MELEILLAMLLMSLQIFACLYFLPGSCRVQLILLSFIINSLQTRGKHIFRRLRNAVLIDFTFPVQQLEIEYAAYNLHPGNTANVERTVILLIICDKAIYSSCQQAWSSCTTHYKMNSNAFVQQSQSVIIPRAPEIYSPFTVISFPTDNLLLIRY